MDLQGYKQNERYGQQKGIDNGYGHKEEKDEGYGQQRGNVEGYGHEEEKNYPEKKVKQLWKKRH
jgi:hypothetical protein